MYLKSIINLNIIYGCILYTISNACVYGIPQKKHTLSLFHYSDIVVPFYQNIRFAFKSEDYTAADMSDNRLAEHTFCF